MDRLTKLEDLILQLHSTFADLEAAKRKGYLVRDLPLLKQAADEIRARRQWKEVDEARFDEMLGVLPPALHLSKGFLVGEPFDHRKCKVTGNVMPSYAAFIHYGGKFYEGPHMTVAEFRAFRMEDIHAG